MTDKAIQIIDRRLEIMDRFSFKLEIMDRFSFEISQWGEGYAYALEMVKAELNGDYVYDEHDQIVAKKI